MLALPAAATLSTLAGQPTCPRNGWDHVAQAPAGHAAALQWPPRRLEDARQAKQPGLTKQRMNGGNTMPSLSARHQAVVV